MICAGSQPQKCPVTLNEAAQALEIAEPTARRWWTYARAWLLKEMREANR